MVTRHYLAFAGIGCMACAPLAAIFEGWPAAALMGGLGVLCVSVAACMTPDESGR